MRNLLMLLALFSTLTSCAQQDKSKRPSPPATATGKIGDATITINYSSPAVKGRKVWGELVPYDKVWRTGANEATIFETDKDIKVEGKTLPAGKYSLYTIPGENEWTIIFNSATGQWGIKQGGVTTEDPEKDVLRVKAKSAKSADFNERFTINVGSNDVSILWENLEVKFKVE
jgi:Protein of unknown function (DUF2911)